MRTEEGGTDEGRAVLTDTPNDAQHFQFVLCTQSVTAFNLDGAGTLLDHLVDALHRLAVELIFAGLMQAVGRIEDTSAAAGDLLVGETVDLIQKLALARTCIYDMRVRVAEGGHHQSALGIEVRVGIRGHLSHWPEGGNTVAVDEQVRIFQHTCLIHLASLLAQYACGNDTDDLADILNTGLHGG